MEGAPAVSGKFASLKTVPGITDTTYVVIAEAPDVFVAIKPQVNMVYFDQHRRFFQIGFHIHVRPQEGATLDTRENVEARMGLGYLRHGEGGEDKPRYVGDIRVPVCNPTLSPWVVQKAIVEGKLIEMLVDGLYERLEAPQTGLTVTVGKDMLIEAATERFLDMVPDNSTPLPEVKCYFGKDSYYPPKPNGPPSAETADDDPEDDDNEEA